VAMLGGEVLIYKLESRSAGREVLRVIDPQKLVSLSLASRLRSPGADGNPPGLRRVYDVIERSEIR